MMEHKMSVPSLSSGLPSLFAAHRHSHAQTTAQATAADRPNDHDGDDVAAGGLQQGAAASAAAGRGKALDTVA